MKRLIPFLLMTILLTAPATATAQTPPPNSPRFARGCPAGVLPGAYTGGFLELARATAPGDGRAGPMGAPLSCEFPDPRGTGDVLQFTTGNGLAFWRKATNTPTWTNGSEHYALVPDIGLVTWAGESIDPPPDALPGMGQGDPRTYRAACERGDLPPDAPICQIVP